MIFLSILAKTGSIALAPYQPWIAALLWLAGMALDFRVLGAGDGTAGSRPLRGVLLLNLAGLVIGFATAALVDHAAMRWKLGIPVLSDGLAGLLRLVGVPVADHDGRLFLSTMAGPLEMSASIDHLGLRVPVVFLALSAVWLAWAEPRLSRVLRGIGLMATLMLAVAIVRSACVVLLFLGLGDFIGYESEELPFRPFAEGAVLTGSYLPFLLAAGVLVARVLRHPHAAAESGAAGRELRPVPARLRWLAFPLLFAGFALAAWQPTGSRKEGKVVINTFHTEWSRTDRAYDKDWYGADSGYNYACLKRLFEQFYPVVELADRIDPTDLGDASVLVLYIPNRRFSEDEIRTIHEFVRGGGGLLVIGDHTNVFGSTSHLNEVCEPLGFQFRDDVLFDLDTDFHQLIDRPLLPSRFWHGMDFFKLRGPCSIRPTSASTRAIYTVDHAKSVRAIYSVNNFYPPPHDHPQMKTGTFCVAAASRFGRGRVVGWGDSTVFSNFEIFYPGKYEFLLNSVEWLNHEDSLLGGVVRRVLPLALLAGLAVFLIRRPDPRSWLATATIAVAAWSLAHLAARWDEARRASFPEPRGESDWLVFAAHEDDPAHHLREFLTEEPYDERYEVFVQWVLRTGAFSGFELLGPDQSNGLYKHLRGSESSHTHQALILRKPDDLPLLAELADGTDPLLLMFDSSIDAATAVKSLEQSGVVSDPQALAELESAWPDGEAVTGADGRRIMVMARAERFSDQAMGISEKVRPDAAQRALFDQAFGVVERLFGEEKSDP